MYNMDIKTQPLLSLSMIVKNEEKNLQQCLDSVQSVVDEIIIVDTGSTDRTVDIAKSNNAKVFSFKWTDDFSAARNFALSKCSGRWILYLDADETLSPGSAAELITIKANDEKTGYRCAVNSINTHGGTSNIMLYTRLFRNSPIIDFTGKIHEQIDDSLVTSGYKLINSAIEIMHSGYDLDTDDLKLKAARNISMLITEYEQSKSSYYAYQLANTFQILEDDDSAVYYYQLALEDKNLAREYKCICYLNIADAGLKKHDLRQALEFTEKGMMSDNDNPMIYMLAARVYSRMNQHNEAVRYTKKALNVNENKRKSVISIRMDDVKIIYQGLLSSLLSSDNDSFNYFLNKLKPNSLIYELINKLYSGEYIDINKHKPDINNDNITLMLNLINKHPDNNLSLEILLGIQYRFSGNAQYLNSLGQAYAENNLYNEAALTSKIRYC